MLHHQAVPRNNLFHDINIYIYIERESEKERKNGDLKVLEASQKSPQRHNKEAFKMLSLITPKDFMTELDP